MSRPAHRRGNDWGIQAMSGLFAMRSPVLLIGSPPADPVRSHCRGPCQACPRRPADNALTAQTLAAASVRPVRGDLGETISGRPVTARSPLAFTSIIAPFGENDASILWAKAVGAREEVWAGGTVGSGKIRVDGPDNQRDKEHTVTQRWDCSLEGGTTMRLWTRRFGARSEDGWM